MANWKLFFYLWHAEDLRYRRLYTSSILTLALRFEAKFTVHQHFVAPTKIRTQLQDREIAHGSLEIEAHKARALRHAISQMQLHNFVKASAFDVPPAKVCHCNLAVHTRVSTLLLMSCLKRHWC